jgi:hypothetical protein
MQSYAIPDQDTLQPEIKDHHTCCRQLGVNPRERRNPRQKRRPVKSWNTDSASLISVLATGKPANGQTG